MTTKKPPLSFDYTMRSANLGDAQMVARFLNLTSQYYLGVDEFTPKEIESEWNTPGFDPEKDTRLVFLSSGELVGYGEVWSIEELPVNAWAWMRLHPSYTSRGIGIVLLSWIENRSRDVFSRLPDDLRVTMRIGCWKEFQPLKDLFEAYGMRLIRHFFRMQIDMDTPPPEPVWSDGINLRTFDSHIDPKDIYRVDHESFRDHFGYVPEDFEEGFKRFMHHMTEDEAYDPNLWFLAMDGDEIAGICLCRAWGHEDRDCGYIRILAVQRPWRKRGIALALLMHAFGEFYRRGLHKVALGVDAENLTGALHLYQKAGMVIARQRDLYEKELRPGREISVENLQD